MSLLSRLTAREYGAAVLALKAGRSHISVFGSTTEAPFAAHGSGSRGNAFGIPIGRGVHYVDDLAVD
jgi:hypothetical protein